MIGTSSASAKRDNVARLGDTSAFSIFEIMARDKPTRLANWADDMPISRARLRTRQPMTASICWGGSDSGSVSGSTSAVGCPRATSSSSPRPFVRGLHAAVCTDPCSTSGSSFVLTAAQGGVREGARTSTVTWTRRLVASLTSGAAEVQHPVLGLCLQTFEVPPAAQEETLAERAVLTAGLDHVDPGTPGQVAPEADGERVALDGDLDIPGETPGASNTMTNSSPAR